MRSAWVLTGLIRSVSLWLVLLAASPALAYTPSSSQEVGLERTGPGDLGVQRQEHRGGAAGEGHGHNRAPQRPLA